MSPAVVLFPVETLEAFLIKLAAEPLRLHHGTTTGWVLAVAALDDTAGSIAHFEIRQLDITTCDIFSSSFSDHLFCGDAWKCLIRSRQRETRAKTKSMIREVEFWRQDGPEARGTQPCFLCANGFSIRRFNKLKEPSFSRSSRAF